MTTVEVRNMTRRQAPRFPYEKIAPAALPGWEISLVYVGKSRAIHFNKALRKKSYAPNVLSYQTGKKSGEIIICLEVAEKQASDYALSYRDFTAYLFIHGLMHLKGHPHGPTMERNERELMSRFINVSQKDLSNGSTNRNRNRHRDQSYQGGNRRGDFRGRR